MKVYFRRNQRRYLLEAEGKVNIVYKQVTILVRDNSVEPRVSEDSVQYNGEEKQSPGNHQHKNLCFQNRASQGHSEKSKPVSIHYTQALNEILKDMLQEERKLQHIEGLKCKIGF